MQTEDASTWDWKRCRRSAKHLVPVHKKVTPSSLNNRWRVALTSHIMKALEEVVLAQQRLQVCASLDPLQFTYWHYVGVRVRLSSNAIVYLLRLQKAGSTVWIMSVDFLQCMNHWLSEQTLACMAEELRAVSEQHKRPTWDSHVSSPPHSVNLRFTL